MLYREQHKLIVISRMAVRKITKLFLEFVTNMKEGMLPRNSILHDPDSRNRQLLLRVKPGYTQIHTESTSAQMVLEERRFLLLGQLLLGMKDKYPCFFYQHFVERDFFENLIFYMNCSKVAGASVIFVIRSLFGFLLIRLRIKNRENMHLSTFFLVAILEVKPICDVQRCTTLVMIV